MISEKILDAQALEAICKVIGDTNKGLTKSEIERLLQLSQIQLIDDGSSSNGYHYISGLSKSKWLFNCLANEINTYKTYERVILFIQNVFKLFAYTKTEAREKYTYLLEETNKVLLLDGLKIDETGSLIEVVKATTLEEVDRRVNNLKKQLYNRAIHREVQKYCIKDYLREDYYDTVFEAAKSLAERVRQISGLNLDGGALFKKAFERNDPYVFINSMKSENEINETLGLKELLEAIFHLVRNPAAHTPKINWVTDETEALDVLTVISFAHKYLDECKKIPGK